MTTTTSAPRMATVTEGTSPRAELPRRTSVASKSRYSETRSGSKRPNVTASCHPRSVSSIRIRVTGKSSASSPIDAPTDVMA